MQPRRPRLLVTNTPVRYFGRNCGSVVWAPEISAPVQSIQVFGVWRARKKVFHWSLFTTTAVKAHGAVVLHQPKFSREADGRFVLSALTLFVAHRGGRFTPTYASGGQPDPKKKHGVLYWKSTEDGHVEPPPPPPPPESILATPFEDISTQPSDDWVDVP